MDLNQIRLIVQWFSLIGSNIYLGYWKTKQVYQGTLKSVCVPFLNCHTCPGALFSCPIGNFQDFVTMHKIPYLILAYFFAIGITIGSMVCGWLCPFGLIQDLMHKIESIKIRIPKQLSQARYFVLIFLVILIPYITQETWFSKLCPMGTLEAAIPWAAWNPTIPVYNEPAVDVNKLGLLFVIKLIILVAFLLLFIVSKRPFCKLACPIGAILGFFNKYSLFRMKVDTKNCKDCGKCVKDCPVDINVSDEPNSSVCVRCLSCLSCDSVKFDLCNLKKKIDVKQELLFGGRDDFENETK